MKRIIIAGLIVFALLSAILIFASSFDEERESINSGHLK